MRSYTRGNIRAARRSLKAHRSRTYLTILGIVIGIAAVVTVTSIGEGVKRQVLGQINHAGSNVIIVRPGNENHNHISALITPQAVGALTDRDALTVQRTHGVAASSPVGLVPGTVKAEHGAYTKGNVVASNQDLPQLLNKAVAYGDYFTEYDDGDNVAILGQKAALAMFDQQVPLGQTFTIRGQQFMVRGIFNSFGSAPLSSDVSFDDAIFIPYKTAKQITSATVQPYEIVAKTDSKSAVDSTQRAVRSALLKNHGDAQDFTVLKASQSVGATDSVLNLLTELTIGAAAICLFVGGIGIMNITLVSVTERMHEIGIRKAVGATNRQISNEFITEAVVLSVFGGIVGIVASLIINLLLRIFTDLQPVLQWPVLVGATLISMLIGVIFGSVPALKAARKDPIAALRGEI